jgi:dTDP-4-dehydrorhamnose 3,5-epimerase-like enzyme
MHLLLSDIRAAKAVWVTSGQIRSIVLDLRRSSRTFAQYSQFSLDSADGLLIVPAGCANGFETLADDTIVNYAQEQDYDASKEAGIRWNSFGCSWLTAEPILSERDQQLPRLSEFESPFD